MSKNKPKVPAYRLHKPSDLAVVRLNGKDVYLGKHGSAASKRKYEQVISEWLANHCQLPSYLLSSRETKANRTGRTINELFIAYWEYARSYYVRNGEPTATLHHVKTSAKPLCELFGHTPLADFGPLRLKAVRQHMIEVHDWNRSTVNKSVGFIKRMFKWGVENEMVEVATYQAIATLSGLRKGRSEARETVPVRPVPRRLIDAVEPYVSKQVWAMVQLQLHTGMRPGEVVSMRRGDLDTTGRIWLYRPASHKTEHYGHQRRVYMGPQAQKVIMKFLDRNDDAYLFSPAEAEQERRIKQHAARQTPLSCGNRPGTNRRRSPKRKPGSSYDVPSYRRAIRRGCDKAFPWLRLAGRDQKSLTVEERVEMKLWLNQHRWHPHQLRHNAATYLRKEFGIEAARLILGHRSASVTEIYAELDHERAARIMGQVG